MEEYMEELRTPPVALSCLVGCLAVHGVITAHLHAQQPPINSIALPDFSKISVIPPRKSVSDSAPSAGGVGGIIKRDWLSKHRTRIPAVVAALFSSDDVSPAVEPARWQQVCADLDYLKSALAGRSNIRLVLVIVTHSRYKDETSEDRVTALRKRAEVDSKHVVFFITEDQSELKQSLIRLSAIFSELANTYYKDEGRRIKTRIEKKNFSSVELNVRYCFKVAVYAEFRSDWLEALKFYEDAYHAVREAVGSSTRLPPIQRLVEIKTVAEQLHFKVCTLLLHGGKVAEAILWFRQHAANYRRLLGVSDVVFLHWEWLSRQYLVFAQLLETSLDNVQVPLMASVPAENPSEWEYYPAYYYQLAASYLKEKNKSLELALSMSEDTDTVDGSAESVVASAYLGQFAALMEREGTCIMQSLTDEEYTRYVLAEGKRLLDSYEIIALLQRSFKAYSDSKSERRAAYCGFLMAREYFLLNDFGNAKKLFEDIANLYRREGWLLSLWEVLGYLRECYRRTSSVKDFVEYSLEMAAVPITNDVGGPNFRDSGPAAPANLPNRTKIQKEAFQIAIGESQLDLKEPEKNHKVSRDYPLYLEIDLVSPLRAALLALVSFHQSTVKPGVASLFTIALRSQLPVDVELDQLEVQFNQSECNFLIANGQNPQMTSASNIQTGRRVETAPNLLLTTNKWLRLTHEIKSDQSGKLECIYVIARIGSNFTICCRAESPASMSDLPLWKFENLLEAVNPIKDPGLAFSGQKTIQVEEPDPQVDLILTSGGPAFVGESFILPVTVASVGHSVYSGELKINLVDTRGGGLLSPRDQEPFSSDDLHVELIDISCDETEEQSDADAPSENIQKIQPSFGLISVPSLSEGKSWSCKLKIKWNRPKPIMLYVSLGYYPHAGEPNLPKVHVHKSLQIEGKTALTINHRYMLPFRQDPLLLSMVKPVSENEPIPHLAFNEPNLLIVSVVNISELPLQLLSISIDVEDDNGTFSLQPQSEEFREPIVHVPGGEFKKVFTVIPKVNGNKLRNGTVSLKWQRKPSNLCSNTSQVTKLRLPNINVEVPPLSVRLECPPHAVLGNPFTYSVKIRNQTDLLQEIKYSLADMQNFVSAGPHNDTVFVMPRSAHVLHYMLVPLGLGSLQLPKVSVTSLRHSVGFQPSNSSTVVFVYPSKPSF